MSLLEPGRGAPPSLAPGPTPTVIVAPPALPPPRRDLPRLLTLLAVIAAALALAWFVSPWWATWRLVQDARAGDARAVARRLDGPLVHESLQPQLETRVRARL
ncbi:MAG: DUF2939 domain-containing protein, partial [Caulobacteraceae bacterium]|nr:DUF2939 domain-containing protein [Caulobacter sp.]